MLRSKAAKAWQKPERRRLVVPADPPATRAVMVAANEYEPVPKDVAIRSEAYRRWVAEQPCLACGLAGRSQAAHSNSPQHGKGMSRKADDRALFPLCCAMPGRVGCHEQHDMCIGMTRAERRLLEVLYVANTQQRAADAGWDLNTLRRKA